MSDYPNLSYRQLAHREEALLETLSVSREDLGREEGSLCVYP